MAILLFQPIYKVEGFEIWLSQYIKLPNNDNQGMTSLV